MPAAFRDDITSLSPLITDGRAVYCAGNRLARWQSGYAAACKAADIGSIPFLASIRSFTALHILA